MDIIGESISNLIKTQFPEIYREHGPLYVVFVEKYFEWLEERSVCKDEYFPFRVTVANRSANVVGFQTTFVGQFEHNDQIAICKDEQTDDYDIFTVDTVVSNTLLTLTTSRLPNFSITKTLYSTVSEKPNSLFLTRRFFDIRDIDETFDEYVIYFKEKYLKHIQFRTITDTKTLVKHSLDLYRSKGTERATDLLHKIVFGKPATVYYPKVDLFKPSTGDWYIPRYLELSLSLVNRALVNKEIVGTVSGATAFVEEIIRTRSNDRIIEVAYISAINGNFLTGEKVTLSDNSLALDDAPIVVGSLNEIMVEVSGVGVGFENNQIVDVTSINGTGGKAKVVGTANTVGQLFFSMIDGGYGFANTIQTSNTTGTVAVVSGNLTITGTGTLFTTEYSNGDYISFWSNSSSYSTHQIASLSSNTSITVTPAPTFSNATATASFTRYFAQTFVSENILHLEDVTITPAHSDYEYFPFLGTITQPMAEINYVSATGALTAGANLFTYYANNFPKGTGRVLFSSRTTETSGLLIISVLSGNMHNDPFYTTSNTLAANLNIIDGYTDTTATAEVIGNYSNVEVTCNGYVGTFQTGEVITQPSSEARGRLAGLSQSGNTVQLAITGSNGVFKDGGIVFGQNSAATATAQTIGIDVGVVNVSNTFLNYDGNLFTSIYLQGTITLVSTGVGAEVTFSTDLENTEVISYTLDQLEPYAPLALNTIWPFPSFPTSNLATIISTSLQPATLTIGSAVSLVSFSPGQDYNRVPIIRLHEPTIYSFDRPDTLILTVSSTAGFELDELVTQANTSARGSVEEISNSQLTIRNLRFSSNNGFVVTTSANTLVVGSDSGAFTNVTAIESITKSARMGSDITMDTDLVIGSGAITSLQVLDSGFGFTNGEDLTITGGTNVANGVAIDSTHGTGSGFYRDNNGFISDDKMLSDGWYWQEYSYEVRSGVVDDFKDVLKDIIHVAGTKYFSALVYDSINTIAPTATSYMSQANSVAPEMYWSNTTVLVWGTGNELTWG